MKTLALELSSSRGSIAWVGGGASPVAAEFANDRKHSGRFFETLQQYVARFGHPNRIVVGLGPGSYAGTRIAIAAAIGLRTAAGAELSGISSIIAMGTNADEYAVVGDARRQSFYFARVKERRCLEGPALCNEGELRERLSALNLPVLSIEPMPTFPSVTAAFPSALILAQLSAAGATSTTDEPLEPIYLRDPHITMPRTRKR
jgi:tRNA threonylcarbamoyl adenosine modification protein YeaZ